MTISAVGSAIAHQRLVDALARLTAKLIRPACGTTHLVRLVRTVLLAVTTPGGGYAVLVHVTNSRYGSRAREMIWATGGKGAAVLLVLQQH